MRREAVVDSNGPETGIASGFNIDVRVADDRGFLRSDAVFFEQFERTFRFGLLRCETVSTVDFREERAQAERINNGT